MDFGSICKCPDCDYNLPQPEHLTQSSQKIANKFTVCFECSEKRKQRKKAIVGFIQSEIAFGEDIRTLLREVSDKLVKFGSITDQENKSIFCNLTQVITENEAFLNRIREQIWKATQNGDSSYVTLKLGAAFLRSRALLNRLETYTVGIPEARKLLEKTSKQKQNVANFLEKCWQEIPEMQTYKAESLEDCLSIPSHRFFQYPKMLANIRCLTSSNHQDWCHLGVVITKITKTLKSIELQKDSRLILSENLAAWSPRVNSAAKTAETLTVIDWPKIALREAQSLGDNITLVMADYIGYDYGSHSKSSGTKSRKFVAMLVTVSSKVAKFVPSGFNPDLQIYLMILKQVSVNDFVKVTQLDLKNCMLELNKNKESMLEITNVANSEVTRMKFPSFEIANEWLLQCTKLGNSVSQWNKRRNACAELF